MVQCGVCITIQYMMMGHDDQIICIVSLCITFRYQFYLTKISVCSWQNTYTDTPTTRLRRAYPSVWFIYFIPVGSMATHHKVIVIGAGVSGLVTLKTLQQLGIDCIIYEANSYHGGLWHFHPDNYGVAEFTYMWVDKSLAVIARLMHYNE